MALLLAVLGAFAVAGTSASGAARSPLARADAVEVALWPSGYGRIDAKADDGSTASCDYTTVLQTQNECRPTFAKGAKLELTATAEPGAGMVAPSEFVHWSWSGCPGTGTCTITVGDDDWVSAVFTPLGLEIGMLGDGDVSVEEPDSAQLYPDGCADWFVDVTACRIGGFAADERVVLVATPAKDGDAVHWGPRCEDGSSGATCVVRVTNIRTFATVGFGDNQPPDIPFDISPIVDIERAGSGSGTVKGHGKDARGDDWSIDCPGTCKERLAFQSRITLTAQEDVGSRFVRWEHVCSTDRTCTFSAGSETNVIAVFEELPPAQTTTGPSQTQTQPTQTQPTQTQPPQPAAFSPQIRRVTAYATKSARGLKLVLVVDRTSSAKASLLRKVVVRKRTRLRSVAGSTFALAKGRNSVRLALRKGLAAGWYTLSIRFVGPGGESAVVTRPIRWRP